MNSVEQALNTPASDPISADSSPATTMPRIPGGSRYLHHHRKRAFDCRSRSACRRVRSCAPAREPCRSSPARKQISPGMMNRYTGNSFRNAAKMLPRRAIGLVRRAQRALHDVLVRAPIPEPDDRRAEQHAQPREVAIEVPRLADHLARGVVSITGAHVPSTPARDQRLPEIEHLRAADRAQLAPSRPAESARRRSAAPSRGSGRTTCTASL